MKPPPYNVALYVERAMPGFWREFIARANAGFGLATERGAQVHVTSWYRSPDHNAALGGNPQSQHLLGMAFDVVSDDWNAAERGFRAQGFTVVDETRTSAPHLHVQAFQAGALRRVFGF